VRELRLVDAPFDSKAGGRPNFLTTQWGLVAAAAAEGTAEARAVSMIGSDFLGTALRHSMPRLGISDEFVLSN
jgi:sugar/nucleoside kinase (ribokinase family)